MTPLAWFATVSVALAAFFTAIFQRYYNPPAQDEPIEPLVPVPAPPEPPVAPVSPPVPPRPAIGAPGSLLWKFADAIATYEGGHTPGTRPSRNCNPLDYRWPPSFGPKLPDHATGVDNENFLIFDFWDNGFNFGKANIRNACEGKSEVYHPMDTIAKFFAKFAPDSDGNNSTKYAQWVANRVGLSPDTQIRVLLT